MKLLDIEQTTKIRKTIHRCACVAIIGLCLAGCGDIEQSDLSLQEADTNLEAQNDELQNLEDQKQDVSGLEEQEVEEDDDNSIPEWTYDINLTFAGDINLAEDYGTTDLIDSNNGDISACIDPTLIDIMRNSDYMVLNNEFAYSDRGTPLDGKMYTFRANPDRVSVLNDMGVDAVYLANNHVYDYGPEACLDTFDTLDGAGVKYFGAGRNIDEATSPLYLEIQGVKIALVAASRAEKLKMTPQATDTEPGILRCYDTELFCDVIEEAAANADITIAVVHWGTEYSTELEEVQLETAREYVKAGADVIIGAHSHCLQGIEYVYGVPVLYSMGNYWFNEKTLDTMLANIHLYGNEQSKNVELSLIPGVQEGWHTRATVDEAEARRIFDDIEAISIDVRIDDDGTVHTSGPMPLIENLCEVRFEVDYPVGQITKDVRVSQDFVCKTDSILALDLLGATYKRDNTATIDVELMADIEGNADDNQSSDDNWTVLAKWSLDSAMMQDNTVMEFVLGDESAVSDVSLDMDEKMVFYADTYADDINTDLVNKRCKLVISSEDGEPDMSPTFWMTESNNYPDGCLNIAGYDQYNDIWFQIYGLDK